MKIETKFDVGEWVWLIHSQTIEKEKCTECGSPIGRKEEHSITGKAKIYRANVRQNESFHTIGYELRDADGEEYYKHECNLFRTRIKAEQECERRNKSNG